MRMMVRCGDQDCKMEFYVESKDPIWECPNCERTITNRNYPFLTAKLMQAKIDGDSADWEGMFKDLVKTARIEINARNGKEDQIEIIDLVDKDVSAKNLTNAQWKEEHDKLLEEARKIILDLEGL